MFLKHIVRVNASYIICTQYELNDTEYTMITENPSQLPLVFVLQSLNKQLQCSCCSNICDWESLFSQSLSKRMTKLIAYEECDTYVRDDICAYCSVHCLMCDSQDVLDDQTHIAS